MEQRGRSRRTVLLVVADGSLARVMERALRDRRFVVTKVTTGNEALELLRRQHPDSVSWTRPVPMAPGKSCWNVSGGWAGEEIPRWHGS
jgi:DNA-binding response OmpR family regulator